MKSTDEKAPVYKTNSLPLASYLSTVPDLKFVGVDNSDIERIQFCYEPAETARSAADQFFSGEARVDPQDLFQNYRTLKDLVFEVKRNPNLIH